MTDINVLVLVGSLRAASINRQIAELAAETAPDGVAVTVFDGLGEVPFYNEDVDTAEAPEPAIRLRRAAANADAALVVTPEYNGTLPAVLKNAIDWLSRPYGQGALGGKPVAVIGAAAGRYGGQWAIDDARKSLTIAGTRVIDGIELAVPIQSLDGKHPREHADLIATVRGVLGKLAVEVG